MTCDAVLSSDPNRELKTAARGCLRCRPTFVLGRGCLACPCPRCGFRGWYPEAEPGTENDYPEPTYNERYCDCPHGERLRERDDA